MRREDRQTQLNEKTSQLLRGPLKHARAAALALSLVPLASVAATAQSNPCEWYSGGFGVSFVDPVPDLIGPDGQRVTTDSSALATKGRRVMGVGADGVTQVVLRISGNLIYALNGVEHFTVTVLKDETVRSQSVDEDGGLGAVGTECPGAGCQSSQITVATSCIPSDDGYNYTPMAFAVYRSPSDFPRSSADDSQLAYRDVYIHLESINGSMNLPVRIVRPPVALIHGLWDDWKAWNKFAPLVTGPQTVDPKFSVLRVSYDDRIGSLITSSTPSYSQLSKARANSLGFLYNAGGVLKQIRKWMEDFKGGHNPANIKVAAVQADIVAHSMGGDIARTLGLPAFVDTNTFRQGVVHKVITIDTPHLGSAVATNLSHQTNSCLQDFLASKGKFSFQSVVLQHAPFTPGAIGDLIGDLTDVPLSQALEDIRSQSVRAIRVALVAGIYTNFSSLNSSVAPSFLRNRYFGCPNDPLAQALTETGWPSVFEGNPNDAIVSLNSQWNGAPGAGGFQISGVVHSDGTTSLGFAPPSVLDPGTSTAGFVIQLLNTPLTNSAYYRTIP